MCIDTLHIKFIKGMTDEQRRLIRRNRDLEENIRSGIVSNPDYIDMDGVIESLTEAGYRVDDMRDSSSGNTDYAIFKVRNAEGRYLHINLKSRSRGSSNFQYLSLIDANPTYFQRWSDFWAVIEAMDGPSGINRVIDRGIVHRIDYHCDYMVPFADIMRGMYVSRGQTLFSYEDFDDDPHIEYRWNRGTLSSFKVGAGKSSLKIYDKAREEEKKARRMEGKIQRLLTGVTPPRAALSDDEEDDEEDDFDFGQSPRVEELQQYLAEIQASISQAQLPKTRIERSIIGAALVGEKWDNHDPKTAMLSQLPAHVRMITQGLWTPFEGVLLNHINMRSGRGVELDKTDGGKAIRHDVNTGLFMNVIKRLNEGRRFWTTHRAYFTIYPWKRE